MKTTNKKLRIAIFHLAFIYSGGGERLVLEEAIGLQQSGYEVTCFAPIVDNRYCFPELMSRITVIPLVRLPLWFPDVEFFSILLICLFIPFFAFRFRNFDLYFGANQPGPWIAYILSKINRKPYAIYLAQPTRLIHPRLIDQKTGLRITDGFTLLPFARWICKPLIDLFDTRSIQNAKIIFANGSYAKGMLDEVYNITTINCPAGAHRQKKPGKKDIAQRFSGKLVLGKKRIHKPYVLITNRHFPQKKFEYAIDAVLASELYLDIVITGKPTAYTKFLQERYKEFAQIHFIGLVAETVLETLYKNAAVYTYPSPEEDFGMGIVEAMAYAVPVVAWGNAGPTGIIDHHINGLLAKPFDVQDFSEQIKKLVTNKKLYEQIAYRGYEKCKEKFTYENHKEIIQKRISGLDIKEIVS